MARILFFSPSLFFPSPLLATTMPPKQKQKQNPKKRKAKDPPQKKPAASDTTTTQEIPLLNLYRAKLLELAKSHSALLARVSTSSASARDSIDLTSYSQLSSPGSPPPSPPAAQASHGPLFDEGSKAWAEEINAWLSRYDAASRLSLSSDYNPSLASPPAPPSPSPAPRPKVRVGVGVLLRQLEHGGTAPPTVIAGVRKGSHGAGSLALPGGHLEFGESWAECAAREVMEECGLTVPVEDLRMLHVTNDVMESENKHYVTIFMCASVSSMERAENLEPDKCAGWGRYKLSELRAMTGEGGGLFGPLRKLVEEEPAALTDFLK